MDKYLSRFGSRVLFFTMRETHLFTSSFVLECFTGAHRDVRLILATYLTHKLTVRQIGGGYKYHDLADLTLTWMAVRSLPLSHYLYYTMMDLPQSNIDDNDLLSLNHNYLRDILCCRDDWGKLPPHQ